jgi:hypothetical protein
MNIGIWSVVLLLILIVMNILGPMTVPFIYLN